MSWSIDIDRARFEKDGYLLLKNVFSVEEIERYRDHLEINLTGSESFIPTDVLSEAALSSFIADGRLIEVARQLLGGTPVYFGDSSANRYSEDAPVGTFHKDNTDRHDVDAPDWAEPYPLLRFGLYLQDHARQGGGLLLRAGSHNQVYRNRKIEVLNEEVVDWLNGRSRYVFSNRGDLVVWNMRLTHAGMGRFLRGPLKRPITERMQRIVPEFLQSRLAQTRYSMFASFGREGPALDRHLRYLRTRRYMVDMWRASNVTPDMREEFERHGAKLLDMGATIAAEEAAGAELGQFQKWAPLPY